MTEKMIQVAKPSGVRSVRGDSYRWVRFEKGRKRMPRKMVLAALDRMQAAQAARESDADQEPCPF